jgi:hypothetical protein
VYELLWINQDRIDAISSSRLYRFDKKFLFTKPIGDSVFMPVAFSQCDREYLLMLDQDRLSITKSLPWFSFSMDLRAHPAESIDAISLHVASLNGRIARTKVQSCLVPSGTVWKFDHRILCLLNRPVVSRTSNIRTILAKYAHINEYGPALAAKSLGYR